MRYYIKVSDEQFDRAEKAFEFYHILIRWIELMQKEKKIAEYFEQNEYQTVAVYGMKEIGILLCTELKQEKIDIRYAIDKNAELINNDSLDIEILKPSTEMPKVDIIIVTAIHYFDSIYMELRKLTEAEIVSIVDVLWAI